MEKSLTYILIFVFLSLYIPVLSQEVNNKVPSPYKRTAQVDSFNTVDNTAQQSAYSKYHRHHYRHHKHHRVISNNHSKETSKIHSAKVKVALSKYKIKWWIIIIIALIIIQKFFKSRRDRKCKYCGRWGAMRTIGNRECIEEKPSTIKEERRKRNAEGEVLETNEVDVPATTYIYRIRRKCKYCGYEDYKYSSVRRKN
jgi:hypothetical protein